MNDDYTRTLEFFQSLGLEPELAARVNTNREAEQILRFVSQRTDPKVVGYYEFFVEFTFVGGEFRDLGIWE